VNSRRGADRSPPPPASLRRAITPIDSYHAVRACRTDPRDRKSLFLRARNNFLPRAAFPLEASELPELTGDVLAAPFPAPHRGPYAPDGHPVRLYSARSRDIRGF